MTTTEDTESMEARAARLLKRAEDFRRHGEDGSADAALALAERIMLKYSLNAAIVAARTGDETRDVIVTEWVEFTGIYRAALVVRFAHFVTAYSDAIRCFVSRADNVHKLALIGRESDVQQLRTLIVSIQLQAIGKMNIWWQQLDADEKVGGMAGYKTRREFVGSFVAGAAERVRLARRQLTDDAEAGTALVIREYGAAVDAYVAATYRLRNSTSRLKSGSARAHADGRAAGRLANTGDTPGTNRRLHLESS